MKTRQEMIYDFMLALAPTTFEQLQIMDDYAKEEGIPPISNDMVFRGLGYTFSYSTIHLKTRPFKIRTFLSGFQKVFDKMMVFCLDFKW